MYGVVYKITNTLNGNFYIGQTKTKLSARWAKHKQDARSGKGWVMAAAIRKYGPEAFTVEVIEICGSKEALNFAEYLRIRELQPAYNSMSGGGGLGGHSQATKQKISAATKGRRVSDATRKRMSAAQKGHRVAPETVAKIQAALAPLHAAKKLSRLEKFGTLKRVRQARPYVSLLQSYYDEVGAKTTVEKIAAAASLGYATGRRKKLVGGCNPMFGVPKPTAIKAQLSERNTGEGNPFFGKLHTEDTRAKMREAHANRSPITCPHCSTVGHPNAMKRWHFDNCRTKP